MNDLSGKVTEVEYKISELIDLARQKGVQLESR